MWHPFCGPAEGSIVPHTCSNCSVDISLEPAPELCPPYIVDGTRQRYFPREIELAVMIKLEYSIRKGDVCMFQFLDEYDENDKIRLKAMCDFLHENGWILLATFESRRFYIGRFLSTKGHCASAFYNIRSRQLVIVHRGSQNPESFKADFTQVFFNRRALFAEMACAFTFKIIRDFGLAARSITVTGHSLGGWLAQVATYSMKFPDIDLLNRIDINDSFVCNFESIGEYVKGSYHLHCVAFDSPGCKDFIEKYGLEQLRQSGVRYPLKRLALQESLNSFDITVYLTLPNFANVINEHSGDIYQMQSKFFLIPGSWVGRFLSWVGRKRGWAFDVGYVQITSHLMNGIVDFWIHYDQRSSGSLLDVVHPQDDNVKLCVVEDWEKKDNARGWLWFFALPRPRGNPLLELDSADLLQFRVSVFNDTEKEVHYMKYLAQTVSGYKDRLKKTVADVEFLTDSFDFVDKSGNEVINIKSYYEKLVMETQDQNFNEIGFKMDLKDEFIEKMKYRLKDVKKIPNGKEACYIDKCQKYIERLPKLNSSQLSDTKLPNGPLTIYNVDCADGMSATTIFTAKIHKHFQSSNLKEYLCINSQDLVELEKLVQPSEIMRKVKLALIEFVEGCNGDVVTEWITYLLGEESSVEKVILIKNKDSFIDLPDLNWVIYKVQREDVQLKFRDLELEYSEKVRGMFLNVKERSMQLQDLISPGMDILDFSFSDVFPYLSSDFHSVSLPRIGTPIPELLEFEYFQPRNFKQPIVNGYLEECDLILISCSGSVSQCNINQLLPNGKHFTDAQVWRFGDGLIKSSHRVILVEQGECGTLSRVKELLNTLNIHKCHWLKLVGSVLVWQESFGTVNTDMLIQSRVERRSNVVIGCTSECPNIVIRCSDLANKFQFGSFLMDGEHVEEDAVYRWDEGEFRFESQMFIVVGKGKCEELLNIRQLLHAKSIETFHLLGHDGGHLVWIESFGPQDLLRFLEFDSHIRFENFLPKTQAQLLIIADEPGMGKTTIMKTLAAKSQMELCWTIFIDLQRSVLSLNEIKLHDNTDRLTQLQKVAGWICNQDRVEVKFVSDCFLESMKLNDGVRIFFDGFDEIDDNSQKKICDMIDILLTEGCAKLLIATRLHRRNFLENRFHKLRYRLEPFEKNESINFLKDFFTSQRKFKEFNFAEEEVRIVNKEIPAYLSKLLEAFAKAIGPETNEFIGRPLQMYMLGVICIDYFLKFCKECVENGQTADHDETFPQKFTEFNDIFSLYTAFINEKFRIGLIEKKHLCLGCSKTLLSLCKDELFRVHRICGFEFIFGIQFRKDYFRLESRQIERDLECLVLGGIVQYVDENSLKINFEDRLQNNITFIHRTLAEYFAADFIVTEFCQVRQNNKSEQYNKILQFMKGNLFLEKYDKCRHFVDSFIINMEETHDVFRILTDLPSEETRKKVETYLKAVHVDCFERTILHYAFSSLHPRDFVWLLASAKHLLDRVDIFGATPFAYLKIHLSDLKRDVGALKRKYPRHTGRLTENGRMLCQMLFAQLDDKEHALIDSIIDSIVDRKLIDDDHKVLDLTIMVLRNGNCLFTKLNVREPLKVITPADWKMYFDLAVTLGQGIRANMALELLKHLRRSYADILRRSYAKQIVSNSLDTLMNNRKTVIKHLSPSNDYELRLMLRNVCNLDLNQFFQWFKDTDFISFRKSLHLGKDSDLVWFNQLYDSDERFREPFNAIWKDFLTKCDSDINSYNMEVCRTTLKVWKYYIPKDEREDILLKHSALFKEIVKDEGGYLHLRHFRAMHDDIRWLWAKVNRNEDTSS